MLAALALMMSVSLLSGCEIDVNKIASQSSTENSSSNAFYEKEPPVKSENVQSDEASDNVESVVSQEETVSEPAFDTSAYKTVYVTGAVTSSLTDDVKGQGKVLGTLQYGESLSFIKGVAGSAEEDSVSFVYSESLGQFGYVKNIYLADTYEECCAGETYYVSDYSTPLYNDREGTYVIKKLSKNDKVTVIAKLAGTLWRVQTKSGTVGYVGSMLLSTERISKEKTSSVSSADTSSVSSKEEMVPITSSEVKNESSSVSSKSSLYTGVGDAPTSGYTVYYVDVDIDYLALRCEENTKPESVIDELYYNDQVYVINSNGSFWYVYAPKCGKYGYISGNPDFLRMEYGSENVYYDE